MNTRDFASVAILALLCLTGCKIKGTEKPASLEAILQASLPPEATKNVNNALESFMAKTPYSALIQNTKIEALDTPDRASSDSDDVITYLYTATVLETYRGAVLPMLDYRLISQAGEAPILDWTPYIVTLCSNEDGYLWPDIGASLPATIETVRKARQVGKTLDANQLLFSDCE